MKHTTRELAILAVFGTLWGLVEISLGSFLKTLNIQMSGVILAAIGLTVALTGRAFVPRKGSTLFVGVIAMLLKLFSLGGVILGPMIGIITEAIVAEIVLTALGQPRRLSFTLAGALGVLWVRAQPFFTVPIFFGRTIYTVWLDLLDNGSRLLGLDPNAWVWLVAAMVALYLVIGAFFGWLSWDIARQLQTRLGRQQTAPAKS